MLALKATHTFEECLEDPRCFVARGVWLFSWRECGTDDRGQDGDGQSFREFGEYQ